MKSKSFDMPKSPADKVKQKTYDFVNFYKTAAETSVKLVERRKSDVGTSKENIVSNKIHTPKRVPNKKKNNPQNDSVDMSTININGDSLAHASEGSSLNDSKVTSTPYAVKKSAEPKVKSIIKNKSLIDSSLNVSNASISIKPKKRNKSVSFMLDDTEGIAMKRSKSEETFNIPQDKSVGKTKKPKKYKEKLQDGKENKSDASNMSIDIAPTEYVANPPKVNVNNSIESTQCLQTTDSTQAKEKPEKKKLNKFKKNKNIRLESVSDVIRNEGEEPKIKKIKKKKRHIKSVGTDNTETEGEPAQKSSKKDDKPEKIAQDLENLNIGDNAHTLTNLLDEMTVVDKNKKNKNKKKAKETKQKKDKQSNASSSNTEGGDAEEKKKCKNKKKNINRMDTDNIPIESTNTDDEGTEAKEKVKWVKRKWNKDKKGGANVDKHLTSVVVENLPLTLMFTYRKLLTEHFEKCGMIRQVGVAEMYPTVDPKPVFTTSINFYSEDAAEKALEDDNTLFVGARIRVKRPMPPTLTTLVVRSYAELTEQALSSVFSSAGRIRSIRHLVKGKKSLSTAFIEFDGPISVERAIKMAEDAKIGGKKIHVAKFELRATNKMKQDKSQEDNEGSDNSNE